MSAVFLGAWAALAAAGCGDDGPVEAVAPDPVPSAGADWQPAFSPDGARIAFVSDRDGGNELFLMGADGSDPVRLSRDSTALSNASPAWSPDGARIAYVSFIADNWEVAQINADGTGHTNLTRSPEPNSLPVWSPGGRIAFTQGAVGQRDILALGADVPGTANLTADNPFDNFNPAFAPDGGRIAFVSNRDGRESVYLMGADGDGARRLTEPQEADEHPVFSPDGARIAFSSLVDGGDEVFIIAEDGGGLRQLTLDGGRGPVFSPDGKRIAYDRQGAVWVMDSDGGRQRPLLTADAAPAKATAALHGSAPAVFSWSPDSRRIALTAFRDDPLGDIFVVEVESGRAFNLTPPAE